MTNQEIRQKLLLAGVKNLTEFGYQSVNTESGWCYEQVCLAEMFKLPKMLLANLLIARVI